VVSAATWRAVGVIATVLVVATAGAGAVKVTAAAPPPADQRARRLVATPGAFTTAKAAATLLVRSADAAATAAKQCAASRRSPACEQWQSASAYARVAAVTVLGCTPAGRETIRVTLADYYRALASRVAGAEGGALDPPPVPRCA